MTQNHFNFKLNAGLEKEKNWKLKLNLKFKWLPKDEMINDTKSADCANVTEFQIIFKNFICAVPPKAFAEGGN